MVALLLDGLDEVPVPRLPACLTALKKFREQRPGIPIAVTCREADYDAHVSPLLELVGAVSIAPLTETQVDAWLTANGLDGLSGVGELLRTPLTLSIAARTYDDGEIDEIGGVDRLFAAYTRRVLGRSRSPVDRAAHADSDVRRWLAALARGMTAADVAAISPRLPATITAAWTGLSQTGLRRVLLLLGALPMTVLCVLTATWFGEWQAGLIGGAVVAVAGWVRAAAPLWYHGDDGHHHSFDDEARTAGEVGRRGFLEPVVACVALGVGLVFVAGLTRGMLLDSDLSWFERILVLPSLLLVGTLAGAMYSSLLVTVSHHAGQFLVDKAAGPGSGWFGNAITTVVAGVTAGFATVAVVPVAGAAWGYIVFGRLPAGWHVWLVLVAGVLIGLASGMVLAAQYAVANHVAPRRLYAALVRAGEMPPRLPEFLAWAESRILLRRTGDEYIFLHALYRDWWAGQRLQR